MNTHYRNRAIISILFGLLMFGLIALLVVMRKHGIPEVLVVLSTILLATAGVILYFRGCFALAKAKGYSGAVVAGTMIISALCAPGFIFLLPLVLLFVLKDKNRHYRSRLSR